VLVLVIVIETSRKPITSTITSTSMKKRDNRSNLCPDSPGIPGYPPGTVQHEWQPCLRSSGISRQDHHKGNFSFGCTSQDEFIAPAKPFPRQAKRPADRLRTDPLRPHKRGNRPDDVRTRPDHSANAFRYRVSPHNPPARIQGASLFDRIVVFLVNGEGEHSANRRKWPPCRFP